MGLYKSHKCFNKKKVCFVEKSTYLLINVSESLVLYGFFDKQMFFVDYLMSSSETLYL